MCVYCLHIVFMLHCGFEFLDTQVSLAPTHVRPLGTLSDCIVLYFGLFEMYSTCVSSKLCEFIVVALQFVCPSGMYLKQGARGWLAFWERKIIPDCINIDSFWL